MNKVDKHAKARAAEYKQRQAKEEAKLNTTIQKPPIRTEQEYQDLIGRRIEEAVRQGAFDNLRGKGKPLNLQRNPFVPEEMEIAYSIMENNQIAPEWIVDRKTVLQRIEQFRQRLQTAVATYQHQWQRASDAPTRGHLAHGWQSQLHQWEEELAKLNQMIATLNLKQPLVNLELFKLRLDEELARAGLR
jgi:DnaJ family protein C protein 28